jgi:hypothetical protein
MFVITECSLTTEIVITEFHFIYEKPVNLFYLNVYQQTTCLSCKKDKWLNTIHILGLKRSFYNRTKFQKKEFKIQFWSKKILMLDNECTYN